MNSKFFERTNSNNKPILMFFFLSVCLFVFLHLSHKLSVLWRVWHCLSISLSLSDYFLLNLFSVFLCFFTLLPALFILDGTSEIGRPVWRKIGNLICVMHLFRPKVVAYMKFISEKSFFFNTCAACSELTSIIGTIA